jgi:ribosomal protein S18 acetylase RimI-like enzyme
MTQAAVTRLLTADLGPYTADYLAFEYAASAPYNCFVFDNRSQADEIRQLLFSSGASEYSPPFGQLLLQDNSPVGMLACLTGKQLTGARLKSAMTLQRAGVFDRYPVLQHRFQLAAQTLLKPQPDDYYLSRIAVRDNERGRGTGSFLMDYFEREALARDCRRLALEVNAEDEQAIRFYRKHEFVEGQRRRVVDSSTGRALEYMHMTKSFV